MARQVPRRNKLQLILLIVFCILFVISTALAILGLVNYDKATQENDDLREGMSDLRKENLNLEGDARDMVMLITGKTGTVESAKKAAEIAYQATEEAGGLAPELELLAGNYKSNNKLVNEFKLMIANLQRKLGLQEEEKTKLALEKQQDRKDFEVKQAELNTNLLNEQKKRDEVYGKANKNVRNMQKKLTRTINIQTKRIERLTDENQEKTDEIAKLKKHIERFEPVRGPIALQADGRIVRIARDANICYINKGTDEKVHRGMTFSIYPSSAVGQSDVEKKGTIRVTEPSKTFSECVIVTEEIDNPILEDDIISSLAYHDTRPQVFVVAGDFDLHNIGQATAADATEVKNAIRRSGGKVATELTIQVDYVVLGVTPRKPTAPAEDAPPTNQKIYQQQLERYNDYLALKRKADNMGVPVLNTNRFIELTGYKPDQIAR